MNRRRGLDRLMLAVLVVLPLALIGCSSKSTEPSADGTCEAKVAQASQALENILYLEINSDPQRPADIDFQSTYQLYQDALLCDATNADASFGVSVLGLLALTSDAEVNAAFDEWKAYLETSTPFETPATRMRPLGVPLSFASGPEALRLPFDLAAWSVAALARPQKAAADPQLSRVQAILETRVLPRLTTALVRLDVVLANPNYRFVVTPRMQGDDGASPVEIDRTDILALRAACGLLASACHVAVSYDLNFAAYDSLSLLQALTPGSGWMALRPSGATHMGNAGLAFSQAAGDLDAAIVSLLAETDAQDDDVIKIGPDGVSAAEAESVRVYLQRVQAGMNLGYTRVDDWDGNPATPDVPLTIRLGQLFANPIQDWKEEFPSYTPSVVRKAGDYYIAFGGGTTNTDVDPPGDGFFQATYVLSVQNQQVVNEYTFGDAFLWPALILVAQDQYAVAQATPAWSGNFTCSVTCGGAMTAGPQSISVNYQTYTGVASSYTFSPVITWDAATFDAWVWPDPTFHGVFPQMASSSQLLETFGITADQWSPVVTFDASESGPRARLARERRLP